MVAKVGPVKATFNGKVTLSDLDPPKAYTIAGEGTGGVAGFAKGSAKVALDEDGGEATVLRYEVQAHVGGKLAQIGSRLIDGTSRKMAEDFFARFAAVIAPEAPPRHLAGSRRRRAGRRSGAGRRRDSAGRWRNRTCAGRRRPAAAGAMGRRAHRDRGADAALLHPPRLKPPAAAGDPPSARRGPRRAPAPEGCAEGPRTP